MSMKIIIYPLLGLGYGVILGLLGFLCVGCGDGSPIPIWIFAGIFSLILNLSEKILLECPFKILIILTQIASSCVFLLFPLLWTFIMFCLAKVKGKIWVGLFFLLMSLQYVSMTYIYSDTEAYQQSRFWQLYHENSFYPFAFYVFLAGQLMIWGIFIYELILLHLKKKHEQIK